MLASDFDVTHTSDVLFASPAKMDEMKYFVRKAMRTRFAAMVDEIVEKERLEREAEAHLGTAGAALHSKPHRHRRHHHHHGQHSKKDHHGGLDLGDAGYGSAGNESYSSSEWSSESEWSSSSAASSAASASSDQSSSRASSAGPGGSHRRPSRSATASAGGAPLRKSPSKVPTSLCLSHVHGFVFQHEEPCCL